MDQDALILSPRNFTSLLQLVSISSLSLLVTVSQRGRQIVTGFTYIKITPVEGSYSYIYCGHSDKLMVIIEINQMIKIKPCKYKTISLML